MSKDDVATAYIALAKLLDAVEQIQKFYGPEYWFDHRDEFDELATGVYRLRKDAGKELVGWGWFNHAGNTYAIDLAKVGCLPSSLTEESIK